MKNKWTKPVLKSREQFLSNFDSLFNQILESSFPEIVNDFGVNLTKTSYPKVDVIDQNSSIVIIAEIPGYSKEDVKIEYDKGALTISGSSRTEKEESLTYLYRELKRSSFTRSFGVDEKLLNVKETDAEFANGILTITIPKIVEVEEETKHTISIK